MNLRSFE
jgi:hypothetical protein